MRTPPNSVAVLYFENATRDTADAYLADGLTEEIITRLSGIERLTVRSRYVVRRYRGSTMDDPTAIGRTLGVTYLVSGSIRRAEGRLRVSAELIRANGGVQVWGRQFDQASGNVFAIQEAVANEVASGIVGRLLPAEQQAIATRPTRNPAAYDHYLRGNFFLARRDSANYNRAVAEYQAAYRADSTFAEPLASLAMTYYIAQNAYLGLSRDTLIARATRASAEAVRRAPHLAESWLSASMVRMLLEPRTLAGVQEPLDRALALDSGNADVLHAAGVLAFYRGNDSLASVRYRRAIALDPTRSVTLTNLGQLALKNGRPADARFWLDSILHFDQDYSPQRWRPFRLIALLALGDSAAARAELAAWMDIPDMAPFLAAMSPDIVFAPRADSLRIRSQVLAAVRRGAPGRGPLVSSASRMLLWRGDPESAMQVLELYVERTAQQRASLRDTAFDPLRGDARFQRLWAETGP